MPRGGYGYGYGYGCGYGYGYGAGNAPGFGFGRGMRAAIVPIAVFTRGCRGAGGHTTVCKITCRYRLQRAYRKKTSIFKVRPNF